MCAAIYRDFNNQDALDRAYDVESSVPDFMAYANEYVRQSATARRSLQVHENVPYGPTLAEHADIFPARRPGAPVLIFVHGGYWRMLTAKEFSFVALGFAPHEVTVVVPTYALCPHVSISEIVRQMRALVAWTSRNIHRFNGDAQEISVCGHSAGGHLAAMCALTDWTEYGLSERVIRSIILISGLFDLEPISRTFMQLDLQISKRDIAEASPQRQVRSVPVRMLLGHGSEEPSEFERHSQEFLAAWRHAGNHAETLALLGRNHFDAITDLAKPDSNQVASILDVMGASPVLRTSSRIDRRLFRQRADP